MNTDRMNDHQIHPTVKVAQDMSVILDLSQRLQDQAIHKANNREMPGGKAMIALAHVANLEAWEHQFEAAEASGGSAAHVADEDDSWEPPLQTLAYWSERWRVQLGAESDMRATLASEERFIRGVLNWAFEHEPRWEFFVKDVRKARHRLEDVLFDGRRDIVSDDVKCLLCDTPLRRRATESGYEDEWWCKACFSHLSTPQFNLAASEAARRSLGLI